MVLTYLNAKTYNDSNLKLHYCAPFNTHIFRVHLHGFLVFQGINHWDIFFTIERDLSEILVQPAPLMRSPAGPRSSRLWHQHSRVVKWASCTDGLFFRRGMNRMDEVEDKKEGIVGSSKAVRMPELLHQTPTDTAERREINTDSRYIQAASGTFNHEQDKGKGWDRAHSMKNVRQQSGTWWRSTLLP